MGYAHAEDSFYYKEWSLLAEASEIGNQAGVKLLIEKGCNPNSKHKNWGCHTALITAATKGHLAIVKLLIESGADINLGDDEGQIPLWHACRNGQFEVVRFLAPLSKQDSFMKSYEIAKYKAFSQICEFLITQVADPKTIPLAVIQNASEPIRKLLVQKGISSEIPQQLANKVTRELKVDHGFTKDQADKFHPLIMNALSKSEFMLSLLDESKPENIAATKALAEGLVSQILRFQKNLAHLTDADMEEGFKEVLAEVKSRDFSSKPAQPVLIPLASTPAAVTPAAAAQPAPTVVYQPVVRVQQAPPAHRPDNVVQNMQAAAQVINAFAAAENGMANLVQTFEQM